MVERRSRIASVPIRIGIGASLSVGGKSESSERGKRRKGGKRERSGVSIGEGKVLNDGQCRGEKLEHWSKGEERGAK